VKFLGKLLTHRGDNIVVRPLEGYCEGILKLYNLNECKPVTTTGTSTLKRTDDGDDELDYAEAKLYRAAVGKLMWLNQIRLDMTYATKELARGMLTPTQGHLACLKHLLRYLSGTRNYGLMLRPNTTLPKPDTTTVTLDIDEFRDSDWAGDKNTRKSTTGALT
jgi:hypothetical protein